MAAMLDSMLKMLASFPYNEKYRTKALAYLTQAKIFFTNLSLAAYYIPFNSWASLPFLRLGLSHLDGSKHLAHLEDHHLHLGYI